MSSEPFFPPTRYTTFILTWTCTKAGIELGKLFHGFFPTIIGENDVDTIFVKVHEVICSFSGALINLIEGKKLSSAGWEYCLSVHLGDYWMKNVKSQTNALQLWVLMGRQEFRQELEMIHKLYQCLSVCEKLQRCTFCSYFWLNNSVTTT